MFPRPRIRIPLWSAVGIVTAAYVVRSVIRGFDFRPDLPVDLVVLALLAVVIGLVAFMRADTRDEPAEPGDDPSTADSSERRARERYR